jgi:hypothetical protein
MARAAGGRKRIGATNLVRNGDSGTLIDASMSSLCRRAAGLCPRFPFALARQGGPCLRELMDWDHDAVVMRVYQRVIERRRHARIHRLHPTV